jgi:hypothetical protein
MTDRQTIERLLRVERGSVRLYEVILPELRGEARAAARHFLGQERRHVDALVLALRGMKVPVSDAVAPIPEPAGGARELIQVAIEHEQTCIRAYLSAQSSLKAPALLGGAAGAMATEAQQLAYLRGLLGDQPVPVAFVAGR